MGRIVFDISMSLDGLITGPEPGVEMPLGDDDGRLHDWMFARRTEADTRVLDEVYATAGAIVMGKGMFDVGVEPWGDPPPFHMPVFVLTHASRPPLQRQGGTTYTFVTGGLEAAIAQARAVAQGNDIAIWGGAHVFQQYLTAGLVQEMQIHLVPVILGAGIRLFENLGRHRIEVENTRVIKTPTATHLRYRVVDAGTARREP